MLDSKFRQLTAAAGVLAGFLAAGTASADTLFGVYAGAGVWQQAYSGHVAAGAEDLNLGRDLDLGDQANNMLYVAVEHGVPLLPNVRLCYTDLTTDGHNVLGRTVTFAGQQFTASENVAARLDLEMTDAVAYYQLLDNVVSLDVGVAARLVDGRVQMTSDVGSGRAKFKGVAPMLYGRARVDLPFSGLWAGAEAMGTGYHQHRLVDFNAQVGWESATGLGAELGWRAFRLDLDKIDQIDSAKVDVSGPYAAVNFHF